MQKKEKETRSALWFQRNRSVPRLSGLNHHGQGRRRFKCWAKGEESPASAKGGNISRQIVHKHAVATKAERGQ